MNEKKYDNPKLFVNRELSWLKFNERVIEEARDHQNPLLERIRFLAISQSNLDEWFMVRVASLTQMVQLNYQHQDAAGLTPQEQLTTIRKAAGEQVKLQYQTLNRILLPALNEIDVKISPLDKLNEQQQAYFEAFFKREVLPVLTPMADDETRPFPFLANDSLNIAVQLNKKQKKQPLFATLQVPDNVFSRLIAIPDEPHHFVLLESIIKNYISALFPGYQVNDLASYRILRDMELDVAEEETPNLLKEVQAKLVERERGAVIRLEVENSMSKGLIKRLQQVLNVSPAQTYAVNGPLNLTLMGTLAKKVSDLPNLKYPDFEAYQPNNLNVGNIFNTIRQQDQLLHHPYDSFASVVRFIQQAATDQDVLAIKMTLYRVSGDSPIIKALGDAAQNGKQVTVLVEVKARFDEENNVHWAKELERMGVHVIYGLKGLKTHCKLTMVIRREEDEIRRYLHLGTGNYNDVTAHFYTDLGLLTADTNMGIDAANIFNILSGYAEPDYFHELSMSPDGIRATLNAKIEREIKHAKAGKFAKIQFKVNSISDAPMVKKLYEASHAGVQVKLIVRGIAILKVKQPEISDNIELHSIVGQFLEHSRIYMFANDQQPEVYLSSADLMSRNLNRRVELLFPVHAAKLRDRVQHIFTTMWHDNVKTRVLQADGSYKKINRRSLTALNAQTAFMNEASALIQQGKQTAEAKAAKERFIPLNNPFEEIDDNFEED
ncbi:RNA degradosome polyphosphate kinase [Periweissella beninensis]|uniref:RNA degradosome polyphosphate kinase n=1 Tax=Periweissella beninensis TaxID=504936 RepID=UPI0021A92261|nr:RNA degradosome polyphosphate kinase [Periweissella beninensis]MCT4395463.1 RNA degradosome polyphosphate kinase [Periweissella beninensis]